MAITRPEVSPFRPRPAILAEIRRAGRQTPACRGNHSWVPAGGKNFYCLYCRVKAQIINRAPISSEEEARLSALGIRAIAARNKNRRRPDIIRYVDIRRGVFVRKASPIHAFYSNSVIRDRTLGFEVVQNLGASLSDGKKETRHILHAISRSRAN